jgi:hypothetical protein
MNKLMLGMVLSALLLGSQANAEVTIKAYKASKAAGGNNWNITKIYIHGLATAFMYANIDLDQRHQPMIYCKPESFSLVEDNLLDLLDTNIADKKLALPDSFPIEGVLLQGLKATFPCK